MKSIVHRNGIFAVALIAILVMLAGVLCAPANVAYAVLPDDYSDYVANLPSDNIKDWYFGEKYLNLEEVLTVVNSWKINPFFDLDSIKEDPIVIAVIDSGIGHAYYDSGAGETQASKKDYYKIADNDGNSLNYYINPLFDDVLLKDADGNYVYKSIVNSNTRGKEVCATLDDSINNIAYTLADNSDDNHGTHVTGIVALLIHALGLEDYIKILPIKANDSVQKGSSVSKFTAHYIYDDVKKAIEFARDNGADIVSLSLTADKKYFSFDEYCEDMLLCAAAGNNGSNSTFSPGYPAASSKVLGVMNYTNSVSGPTLSAKSNYGMLYDIAAPGSEIISTIDGKNGYGTLSGTSMATPIAAFASALVTLRYRGIENENELYITPEIIKTMMTLSANETKDAKSMPTLDLLSLITTDFQSENADDIYVNAEELCVEGPTDNTEYALNDLKPITVRAKTLPKNSYIKGTIEWWYECGGQKTELGTGNTISVVPPTSVGTYAVYCRAVDDQGRVLFKCSSENAYVFTVHYAELDFDNVQIVSADGEPAFGDLYVNEPRIFTISDIEYVEQYKYSIVWFVDDEIIKGATGAKFEFSSKNAGHHKVSARINGVHVYDVEFEVIANPDVNRKFPTYIAVYAISSAVALSAIIAFIVLAVIKKRKPKAK